MWNFIGGYIVIELLGNFFGLAKAVIEEDRDNEIPRVIGRILLMLSVGAIVITVITIIV